MRGFDFTLLSCWLAAALLALGAAVAPAQQRIQRARSHGAKLVATPWKVRAANGIAPGDTIERPVELTFHGRRLAAVYFQVRAPRSAALDADAQHGLQIKIDRCSKRWQKRSASYVCTGKRWVVLSQRPLLGRSRLARLGLRGRGHWKTSHLRLLLRFPAAAGNGLQGQSANVVYSFVGVAGR